MTGGRARQLLQMVGRTVGGSRSNDGGRGLQNTETTGDEGASFVQLSSSINASHYVHLSQPTPAIRTLLRIPSPRRKWRGKFSLLYG